jgi:hypothetical protein
MHISSISSTHTLHKRSGAIASITKKKFVNDNNNKKELKE